MKTTIFSSQAIVFLLAFTAVLILTSCDKRIRKQGSGVLTTATRSLDNFSALDVDGCYDLYVHVDDQPRVVITTDDNIMSEVQTFVQDGKLFIEMSDDYFNYRFTNMEVHVYAMEYTSIMLDGSVDANVQDTLYTSSFALTHEGSGNSTVRFSGNSISLRINGSGNIEAIGTTDNVDMTIDGAGKMNGLDLHAQIADADINGSGDIYVHCDDHLDASIDGSGNIRYIGTPMVNSHISGSGNVSPY